MAGAAKKTGKDVDGRAWPRAARRFRPGRFGTPEEFGAICAFLCSLQAGYITGQNVLADGGAYPGTLLNARPASVARVLRAPGRRETRTMPPTISAKAAPWYRCGEFAQEGRRQQRGEQRREVGEEAGDVGPGALHAAAPAAVGDDRRADRRRRPARRPAASPRSMCGSVSAHSPAANRPDQPAPNTICAIRKAAQSRADRRRVARAAPAASCRRPSGGRQQHVDVARHQPQRQQVRASRRGPAPAARRIDSTAPGDLARRHALAEEQRADRQHPDRQCWPPTSVTLSGVEVFSARYCSAL